MSKQAKVTIYGKEYTLKEVAKEYNESFSYIYKLYANGELIPRIKNGALGKKGKKPYATIDGELMHYNEIAERFGVSISYLYLLGREELERRAKTGSLTIRDRRELQPGERFGEVEIVKKVGTKNHYRAYLVKHVESGLTKVVRGDQLKSGIFTGRSMRSEARVPKTLLGDFFSKHHKDIPFDSFEELAEWAKDHGYSRDKPVPYLVDETKGYTKDNIAFRERGALYTYNGEAHNLSYWAKVVGVSRQRADGLKEKGLLDGRIDAALKGETSSHIQRGRTTRPLGELYDLDELGELIERARGERNHSQFAKDVGTSAQRIQAIALGNRARKPKPQIFQQIADASADESVTYDALVEADALRTYASSIKQKNELINLKKLVNEQAAEIERLKRALQGSDK